MDFWLYSIKLSVTIRSLCQCVTTLYTTILISIAEEQSLLLLGKLSSFNNVLTDVNNLKNHYSRTVCKNIFIFVHE